MNEFYFVGDSKTQKIFGFNLTEEEKDKLFYHIDKGDGYKSCDGRFYGATAFEMKDEKELNLLLSFRGKFKNNTSYSYVVLTKENKWISSGFDETEKDFFTHIKDLLEDFEDFKVFEVTNKGIDIER